MPLLEIRKLSQRDRRALMLLGAVIGIVLLLFAVVLPFYDASLELEENVAKKEKDLGRSVQIIQEEDIYRAQLAQLDRVLGEYRERLLDSQSSSVATVQLEQIVRSIASEHGIEIARSNPLPERKAGERYSKITLQINLQSDMGRLANFLYALAAHPRFLLVEEFFLNSFRSGQEQRIQPRMNISGFIRLS